MIDLQRRGRSGDPDDTAANYIETRPYDIDGDEAGFWGIVPWGRSFGFEGDDLAEFVRLCVLRLLDAGAVPVRHSSQGEPMLWKEQTQYGDDEGANRRRDHRRMAATEAAIHPGNTYGS